MFSFKSSVVRRYDISIPAVYFDSEGIILELGSLIDTDKDIYQYMGLLLLRLGFETEDKILLCNYDKKDCSFDCILNNTECYRIKLSKPFNEIVVRRHNVTYGYECEPLEYGEIGMKVSLGRYSYKYADGMTFTRYLSREKAKFMVSICDYVLELELKCPDDINLPLFDEYGCYAKYKLDNEEDLVKYLLSLEIFGKPIVDVYKELCEMCLSDVSKYPEFSLKKTKIMENGELKITDLITLKNGNLDKFGMTDIGKTVFLDKDDNWLFKMPAEDIIPVDFSISSQNDKITCMFSMNETYDLNDYVREGLKVDIGGSMEEVIDIKRRVRLLFNRNEGSK